MNDLRVLRNRHEALDALIGRTPSSPPDGARSLLVTTTTFATYPTSAGVFYACFATDVTGTEQEGATPTFSQQADLFYVLNTGTAVPPDGGSPLLAELIGGIWVMRYDG